MKKLLLLTIALFTLSGAWADYQKLYVFGDVNGWSRTSMIEMTYDEGTKTYTYECEPTSIVNISFSDKQLTAEEDAADGDWTIFNTNNRYSIGSGNIVPVLGTQYTLDKYGDANVTLEAGTYTLTVNKDMKLTITGTVTPVETTWTVAGTPAEVFGTTWAPTNTNNDMVKGEGNTWTFTKENVSLTAGKIEFKVCKDHAWGIAYPGKNYELTVPEAGTYNVIITFKDDDTKEVSATLEKKYTVSFKNSIGWENVYAYTYGPETLSGWHGTEMNKVGDVYTISFFAAIAPAKIIFNDGVGNVVGESQTANLVFTDGKTYDMVSPGYYIVGNMTSDELRVE